MGLFGSTKKKVSKLEFKQVRTLLHHKGFSSREIDEVEMIFRADLNEPSQYEQGIDANEIDRGIKWMKSNKRSHFLSEGKIEILEDVLRGKL
jgi:hypothetical protein